MGKSVFLMPDTGKAMAAAQMRRLKQELGRYSLSLEGPFSDRGGEVETLARCVQAIARASESTVLAAARASLKPQNWLPEDALPLERSLLEIPFIVDGPRKRGWRKYPENAGAVASAQAVEFQGFQARPTEPTEITMLAVSVLRMLGVECHFSISHCSAFQPDGVPTTMPMIILPAGDDFGFATLLHNQVGFFSKYPPAFFEVLDNDALLSLIKLRDACRHARALMADMARHELGSDDEPALRSMHIGHMLYEGTRLWELSDAQAEAAYARKLFGLDEKSGPRSYRETKGRSAVNIITDPRRHIQMASSVMLCEELRRMMDASPSMDVTQAGFLEFTQATFRHTCCMPQFEEYVSGPMHMMNGHLHPASECVADKKGNTPDRLD